MHRIFPLFMLFLVGCALQPITEPRRPDPESEPTMVPTSIAIEKPTYVVELGSVTSQLFSSGRITPVNQNQISFALGGQIDTLLVDKGAIVNAGDIVATLDTGLLEQSLQIAESDLNLAIQQQIIAEESRASDFRRAEIDVELVQLELDFAIESAGETPTPEQTLAIDMLRLRLELAQLNLAGFDNGIDPSLANQVDQAQLEVDRLKSQIAQSTITVPIPGTVMVVNVAEGDNVAAEETIMVVADLSRVEVQVSLLDRELQQLSEGLVAIGTIPSRPDSSFTMTVRQLPYPYGTGAQGSEVNGLVQLSIDDPAQVSDLGIGDRIEVTILLDKREGVLWLPPAAIREFNGRLFVVVQEGQTQQRLDIKIGLQNENQIEITSGVTEGQLVVGP